MNQSEAKNLLRQLLDSIPSLEFVDFVGKDPIISYLMLNAGLAETEVSVCGKHCNKINWLVDNLTKLEITGRMIISFYHPDNLFTHLPSAQLLCELDKDYRWVQPLWDFAHEFTFIPLDKSFYCQVMWDESAYKIFITYLKDLPVTDEE